ncbi:hypothetical protein [Cryobacterium mannosilyticum]|uniref:hypothetical protein n=1 Tax=Cryobacterium mannosilyticum TaxID=1259190 RepID=UPI0030B9F377
MSSRGLASGLPEGCREVGQPSGADRFHEREVALGQSVLVGRDDAARPGVVAGDDDVVPGQRRRRAVEGGTHQLDPAAGAVDGQDGAVLGQAECRTGVEIVIVRVGQPHRLTPSGINPVERAVAGDEVAAVDADGLGQEHDGPVRGPVDLGDAQVRGLRQHRPSR